MLTILPNLVSHLRALIIPALVTLPDVWTEFYIGSCLLDV